MNNKENVLKTIMTILITSAVVFVLTSSYYINNVIEGQRGDAKADNTHVTTVSGEKVFLKRNFNYDGSFDKLKAVLNIIDRDFLYKDYDLKDLEEGAIKGMISALGDPYTSYFTKSETEEFLTSTNGEYNGIGIYITYGKDIEWPMVLGVIKGSPAEETGVKPGDYIYAISGDHITNNTSLEEVANKLMGDVGTKVNVVLVRFDRNKKQEKINVEIERRKIELSLFEYEMKEDDIGYIKMSDFDLDVDTQFIKAYEELVNEKHAKGLIIDLRDNGGGYLEKALKIADRLVPSGIITYTIDKNDVKTIEYSDDVKAEVPIVVLVNSNSASASEIVAAAIKDYGVGKIVGEKSFGKGLVQGFKNLGDGTYIKVTIAEYFSPNGTKIDKNGIEPDVDIRDNIETEVDEQLEKALEVVKTMK